MIEFCVLGPLEVRKEGAAVALGGAKQRALLAVLLLRAGEVVSTDRLIDELWGDDPPPTAAHTVQVFVSRLRKALGEAADGRQVLITRAPGYVAELEADELDLHRFERLAAEGKALLGDDPRTASEQLRTALALWRGPALADFAFEPFAQTSIGRLEELRLSALADRIEADLALGRHEELVAELETLVTAQPLRERFRGQLMLALYRSGRQADALEAYQDARRVLVDELGIDPSPALQRLERAILRQDPELEPPEVPARESEAAPENDVTARSIVVVASAGEKLRALVSLAELLATSRSPHEVLVFRLVAPRDAAGLGDASAELQELRSELRSRGIAARAAAFTSPSPGDDTVRLAADQKVDLLLTECPAGLLGDGGLDEPETAVLADAPCDVCLVADRPGVLEPAPGRPIIIPFGGGEHDWGALELAAWLGSASGAPLVLLGTTADEAAARDASRLLAVATLAVQALVGISVEPRLAPPGSESVLREAEAAALVVLGLAERWRQEGLGAVRRAVAARSAAPVLLVRRGLRPSGLAPAESLTRFTWSLAGGRGAG